MEDTKESDRVPSVVKNGIVYPRTIYESGFFQSTIMDQDVKSDDDKCPKSKKIKTLVHSVWDNFPGLADTSQLRELSGEGKEPCSKCKKLSRFYCHSCFIPSPRLEGKLPVVRLPLKLDLIKHPGEIDGKSTAFHAPVLAPQDARMFIYPDLPSDTTTDWDGAVLLFPSENSLPLKDHIAKFGFDSLKRLVVIDSTWLQTRKLLRDKRIASLPAVKITEHETLFWRHQRGKPMTYMATVEATYYFYRDLHDIMAVERPDIFTAEKRLQLDNLLYFFKHTHDILCTKYRTPTDCVYIPRENNQQQQQAQQQNHHLDSKEKPACNNNDPDPTESDAVKTR